MKIIILGGGPGGLYSGLLLKKANPAHDITVLERNPRNATYGWGVVFSDRTLAAFREADYKTYKEITDHFVVWDAIDIKYRDETIRCGGHSFAGLSRKKLLNILQARCEELGVGLTFEIEITDVTEYAGYDLVIGADGVNSLTRKTYEDVFQPDLEVGQAKFVWFGTDKVFDSFTFIFRENEHGLFQAHAYPFDGQTSTFIIECDEATWRRTGLGETDEENTIAYCQELFAPDLGHHQLLSNRSWWVNFIRVKNKVWRHRNVVLLGDAVHTAHFSIGSGTKLAMEDAITLSNAFEQHGDDLERALNDYELERRPRVEALQAAARESRIYFENIRRYAHLEPMQFAFHLLTRSGRISYDNLRLRDPYFSETVDRWYAGRSRPPAGDGRPSVVAVPPLFNPINLRGLALPTRVVLSPGPAYDAEEGAPGETQARNLRGQALDGVALVLTEPVAVSPEGRITPGCAGMYRPEHLAAWKEIVDGIHAAAPARLGLRLNHAGRRGSTRPRRYGLDRPLPEGNWPLLSASALPYAPQNQTPKAMDRADMDQVRDAFVRAATMAAEAGFDLLQLHFAHGYLLASFISPLTNVRDDDYGGPLENRLRFPLEVFAAVRATWPEDKPLSVAVSATDWARGGQEIDEAVAVAGALKAAGCDLVEVLAGQTTPDARPVYGPGFLTSFSDRIRSEARLPTMVGGGLVTTDQVNTIL
ncbi:MAG: FAD-dependent monooxygenase, partial [Anaerolineae bacterium]